MHFTPNDRMALKLKRGEKPLKLANFLFFIAWEMAKRFFSEARNISKNIKDLSDENC